MPGLFNNDTSLYEPAPEIENGLWLEQDRDSDLFDESGPFLFIITDESDGTISENEGPDHVKYASGLHAGRYVIDVLNEICRRHDARLNPCLWESDEFWASLGFVRMPDVLKRFNDMDGYYHA